jgi:formyltetrahydrofolate deformylase
MTLAMAQSAFILSLHCPDAIGIVAAVSAFLSDRGLSIEDSDQFHDKSSTHFFMRCGFVAPNTELATLAELNAGFAPIARRFQMDWRIHDADERPKIVIAVSKQGHCLNDLLYRVQTGFLRAEIKAVISNHPDLRALTEFYRLPYHFIPVDHADKTRSEAQIIDIMEASGAELLVLARYMQVLSSETCENLAGRCINIHHSFLPSFKGARPYHQAHARGVKIIGATAHYVTTDLDEGPIIEQATARISHHHTPNDLVEIGRDLECQVLARAVRWHCERRVVVDGQKTVVFV